MGAFQKLISHVFTRLRDTSVSQRVALTLGGALVAISLIWLVQWAASPELVPLLEQDLQPEEMTLVRSGLEALGEKFSVRGNRVFVSPAANRQSLLAQLQQQEKLPANTSIGFTALVKESNPWISQQENDRRWTLALQKELETVLRQFQGVKSASVFLNLSGGRTGFSKLPPASSASVTLTMKNGDAVPRALALAAARMVAGAVAGLSAKNVQVVDGSGAVALEWELETEPSTALYRQRFKLEQHYTEMIRGQIPDTKALVSVVVEIMSTSSNTHSETPVKGVPEKEETTAEETTRMRRSEQPGVQPNVAVAAGGGGGADETRRQDTSKTELKTGMTTRTETAPAGDVRMVTAAISLSSSYLESVFRRANPDAGAPTDKQLEEVFQTERTRLVTQVTRLVKPQTEENVAISRYYDTALPTAVAGTGGALGTLDDTLGLARRYGPQSGLGLLALLSLGLMLRMSKRTDTTDSFGLELGLPKEAIEAAKQAAVDVATMASRVGPKSESPPSSTSTGPTPYTPAASGGEGSVTEIGQAAATEGMLVAQEVDATTIQTRKMLDQVADMVRSDSETVSTLLEQWVQRNEQYRDEKI